MSSKASAQICIKNSTGNRALIQFYHRNDTDGTQSMAWTLAHDETSSYLTVNFETGVGSLGYLDYWAVQVVEMYGDSGIYGSQNTDPTTSYSWGTKECQLQSADAGQKHTFEVSTTEFKINLISGSCTDTMVKLRDGNPQITNVFVLMLENHSFDNIFAFANLSKKAATTSDYNVYKGAQYHVAKGAPVRMTSDPGHEFADVAAQLKSDPAASPSINGGFVSNYATSHTEGFTPPASDIGDVMKCFNTQSQLPVIYQLAENFALCDQWFSSMPGPTWPNRYFVHGASSSGLSDSPTSAQIKTWESISGFTFAHGSIFDKLNKMAGPNIGWRIYADKGNKYSDDPQDGSVWGATPQVCSISGIQSLYVQDVANLKQDLQNPYPFGYTFIEPNYGDVWDNTYKGGSSQHPMDDMYGGEALIKSVYEAIRNSPIWDSSLLIVTYDEHGGFYDSVQPPSTVDPNDGNTHSSLNTNNFNFKTLGIRVPAVVISPLIEARTVDSKVYDHTSILATVRTLLSGNTTRIPHLTDRDNAARDLQHLLTLKVARTDCPTALNSPVRSASPSVKREETPEMKAARDALPMPTSGNYQGFLAIWLKTEVELSSGSPTEIAAIKERFKALKTMGDVKDYVKSVHEKLEAKRASLK